MSTKAQEWTTQFLDDPHTKSGDVKFEWKEQHERKTKAGGSVKLIVRKHSEVLRRASLGNKTHSYAYTLQIMTSGNKAEYEKVIEHVRKHYSTLGIQETKEVEYAFDVAVVGLDSLEDAMEEVEIWKEKLDGVL